MMPSAQRAALERGDARHDVEQIAGLEEHLRAVGGAAERRGDLDLPRRDPERAQVLVERLEIGAVDAVDVGVGRRDEPRGAQVAERGRRRREAAGRAADGVVRRLQAVDAHRDGVQARVAHARRELRA